MEALAGAGLMPLPSKPKKSTSIFYTDDLNSNSETESMKLTPYPTLDELKTMIDNQTPEAPANIEPPSIEPLNDFIEKRTATIAGLKELRERMAKHVLNCKISNTVGNSASIVGGILCFVFPPVGVPVLLAGSATSLGTWSLESMIHIERCPF